MSAAKSSVMIDNVPVSAKGASAWRFVSGTRPNQQVFTVHNEGWEKLKRKMGKAVDLVIENSRTKVTIKQLYILHILPSDSPHRVSFLVSDRRWKWAYALIARDYNMTRRTGDKTLIDAKAVQAPIELGSVVDKYYYKPYSLDNGERWTPRTMIEDVFKQVEELSADRIIESFPLAAKSGNKGDEGGISVQNLMLRDTADVAFARALSMVPGADVYVNKDGKAVVYNAMNMADTKAALREAGLATWDGDRTVSVDRNVIRPEQINVHITREVEILMEYSDDYFGAEYADAGKRDKPYIDNVMPTVDPSTTVRDYDPITDKMTTRTVPQGTFVKFDALLRAWNLLKPDGSMPWTFQTIRLHWLHGDLEGALGAKGLDLDKTGNVANRVAAIRAHFRQTFRVNQRYMERMRDLQAVRVFLLDPVSGTRSPANVWGQACVVPSTKGKLMSSRTKPEEALIYRNVDYYPAEGKNVCETAPGPTRVQILDRDLGIFRLEWISSPYGIIDSFVPCHLVNNDDEAAVPTRDLSEQDKKPMGSGMENEGALNGIFLRSTMKYKVMLTMVPCAPNNTKQFHVQTVHAADIEDQYEGPWMLKDGKGPTLDVFVPASEATARFGWLTDDVAKTTCRRLLGLDSDDPFAAGVRDDPKTTTVDESKNLPGFQFVNEEQEVRGYAKAVAAEALSNYCDGTMGNMATDMTDNPRLRGTVGSVSIVAHPAPSGKVTMVTEFTGQQRRLDRFATLTDGARHLILGIVPFGKGDR